MPPTAHLQPLTTADQSFVWEMLYHAIHVPVGQTPPPREIVRDPHLAHYAQDWGQKPGDLGVAARDLSTGELVGAAWLRLFDAQQPGYGYIDDHTPELSIAILPAYRGQGIGSLLLHDLFQAASHQGVQAISLSVSADNPAAALYQRVGFVTVAQSDSSLTMLKKLQPPFTP